MPRVSIRSFLGGLFLSHPRDEVPSGTLYRASGIRNPGLARSLRSRWGSRLLETFGTSIVHSIVRWHDRRYYGVSNDSGDTFGTPGWGAGSGVGRKLTFASGVPTSGAGTLAQNAGSPEHLFVAGLGTPIKIRDGNVSTRWGIEPPVDNPNILFEAAPVAFANGQNFKFWETFNSMGTVGAADELKFDSANLNTIEIDTVIVPPDSPQNPGSVASLFFDVKPDRTAWVQRAMVNSSGVFTDQDFRRFGNPIGGPPSALQDWIVLDVRLETPETLESFEIRFGTQGYKVGMTHFREIIVDDAIVKGTLEHPKGVADIEEIRADQQQLVDDTPGAGQSSTFITKTADQLAVDRLSPNANSWTRLRIPKSSFKILDLPADKEPWEQISIWEIQVRTNKRGACKVWVDSGGLFGGTGMQGEYQYLVTFRNGLTGSRSNPNPTPVKVKSPYRTGVLLSGLPASNDVQVTTKEIWRTQGNGSLFFLCGTVGAGIFAFLDRVADFRGMAEFAAQADNDALVMLQDVEIQFDNIPPQEKMECVVGPHLGRLFGTRDLVAGHKGRVYWSELGRLEAWKDFLLVTGDNDPMQTLVIAMGVLYAFSEEKCWEIVGTGPFEARELFGVPGTHYPFSVVPTPYGIIYLSQDGVRVLTGSQSLLVAPDAVLPLFRGESGEFVGSFPTDTNPQFVCAEFWNDEYFLTDRFKTLVVNLAKGVWREVGMPFQSMFRERDTDSFLAGVRGDALEWEVAGVTTDAGVPIAFRAQVPAVRPGAGLEEFVTQRLYVDADTNGQTLDVTLFSQEHAIARQGGPFPIQTTGRETHEIALCTPMAVGYVSLTGLLTEEVEVFGVELDVHVPGDPNAT